MFLSQHEKERDFVDESELDHLKFCLFVGHNGVEFYVGHGVMYREETGEPRNVFETEKDAGRQQQDLSIVETEAFADFFWTTN